MLEEKIDIEEEKRNVVFIVTDSRPNYTYVEPIMDYKKAIEEVKKKGIEIVYIHTDAGCKDQKEVVEKIRKYTDIFIEIKDFNEFPIQLAEAVRKAL